MTKQRVSSDVAGTSDYSMSTSWRVSQPSWSASTHSLNRSRVYPVRGPSGATVSPDSRTSTSTVGDADAPGLGDAVISTPACGGGDDSRVGTTPLARARRSARRSPDAVTGPEPDPEPVVGTVTPHRPPGTPRRCRHPRAG